MDCPRCAHPKSRVLQTRREGPETTIRERICCECGEGWHTLEIKLPKGSVFWAGKVIRRREGFQHVKFW